MKYLKFQLGEMELDSVSIDTTSNKTKSEGLILFSQLCNHKMVSRNKHTLVKLDTLYVPWKVEQSTNQNEALQDYVTK